MFLTWIPVPKRRAHGKYYQGVKIPPEALIVLGVYRDFSNESGRIIMGRPAPRTISLCCVSGDNPRFLHTFQKSALR